MKNMTKFKTYTVRMVNGKMNRIFIQYNHFASILNNIISSTGLIIVIFGFYINYKYCNGSIILNILLGFFEFLLIYALATVSYEEITHEKAMEFFK